MKIFPILIFAFAAITTPAFSDGDVAKGEKVYKKCKACHMVGEGAKNKVGPSLNDIIGRPAGQNADFKYSKGMIKAAEGGLIWDAENLDAFMKKPRALVKGTKMSFAGLKKDKDRDNLLAYLDQFSTPMEEPASN